MTRVSLLAQARYAWQNQLYWKPSGVAALYSCHSRNKVTPLRLSSWCTVDQSGTRRVVGTGVADDGNRRCSSVATSALITGPATLRPPFYPSARRGGLNGAGGRSTDCKIAVNIERGF